MEIKINLKEKKYVSLKQASKISGYHPDYIGHLAREGKLESKKVCIRDAWKIRPEEIIKYRRRKREGDGTAEIITIKNFKNEESKIMSQEHISLKQASKISGYHPDYIGHLIREGKIKGIKECARKAWRVTEESILAYREKKKKNKKTFKKENGKDLLYDINPPETEGEKEKKKIKYHIKVQ